jgi:hypothetical protein
MASLLQTIQVSGAGVDLGPRMGGNNTVVGSPATNAETVVCSVPAISDAVVNSKGVWLNFCVSYTVGTSGTAVQYRVRQGVVAGAGTVVYNSGAITSGITAANLVVESINGFDASPTFPGQAYCLTMTVTGGAATSTVSAATAFYIIV